MSATEPEISVVLPGYNEVENIEPMLEKLQEALNPLNRAYEIIYVDDASNDGTWDRLQELQQKLPFLRSLRHRTNFGQSAALHSGYQIVRGKYVVTMDADLQNDPADIPAMLAKLEGDPCDAVCGIRQKRQDSVTKLISSRVANRVRDWLLHDGIHDAGCTMRIVRRSAIQQLPAFRALHRFQPTIMKYHGFRVAEMPVSHHARTRGVSKYGIGNRLWVGILDIIGMRWYRRRMFPPNRLAE